MLYRLDALETHGAEHLGAPDRAGELVGQHVRAADVADLALTDPRRRAPAASRRSGCSDPTSAPGTGRGDRSRADGASPRRADDAPGASCPTPTVAARWGRSTCWRGRRRCGGPWSQRADDLVRRSLAFRIAARWVHVRLAEEGDAALVRCAHDRTGGCLVDLASEGHRAEAEPRHLESGAAESGVLHGRTLPMAYPASCWL